MNPLIFKELKQILKNKGIIVTVDKNDACREYYIIEDVHGKEIIRYTHTNIDKNIYDMRVLGKTIIHWENPAKYTPEMRMLMELVDLIKQKNYEQTALLSMTEHEKMVLKNLRDINTKTK